VRSKARSLAFAAASVLVLACTPADPTYYPSVTLVSKPVESGSADRVRTADAAAVQDCQYVGDFVYDGHAAKRSPAWWAQEQVRALVAAGGATDVVFDSGRPGAGKGCRCSTLQSAAGDAGA
jgi:hypothetical protein